MLHSLIPDPGYSLPYEKKNIGNKTAMLRTR